MQLFYTKNIIGTTATFDENEARHCTGVLRKKIGDEIHFVDGTGNFYKGLLIEARKKKMSVSITEKTESKEKRSYRLHIAMAPTKSNDRFEWFLEKSTEAGIHTVTPLLCRHSERKKINIERWNKILRGAMKQSISAFLPNLSDLIDYREFIKQDFGNVKKYICWCGAEDLPKLKDRLKPNENVLFLIGPEGDFSEFEYQAALNNGFEGISLGASRLRTETAGVFCSMAASFVNQ